MTRGEPFAWGVNIDKWPTPGTAPSYLPGPGVMNVGGIHLFSIRINKLQYVSLNPSF